MGKRIVLILFGGIAALGLVTMLVGFGMGGRMGSYRSDGRDVYYVSTNDEVYLGKAPINIPDAPQAPEAPEAPDVPTVHHPETEGWHQPLDQNAGELIALESFDAVDFDIPAGYLSVVQGDEPTLRVNGSLPYTLEYEDGTLEIKSDHSVDRFTSQPTTGNQNRPRFFYGGNDVTTEFTLTLPEGMALEAELDMGVMTVQGLKLHKLDLSTSAGSLLVENCEAPESEISVEDGMAEIRGLTGRDCDLKVDVGSIEFEGEVTGTLDADCGLGSISIRVPKPASYGWSTEVGLGSISIEGDVHSSGFGNNSSGNRDTLPFFDLECGLGSIEVSFT